MKIYPYLTSYPLSQLICYLDLFLISLTKSFFFFYLYCATLDFVDFYLCIFLDISSDSVSVTWYFVMLAQKTFTLLKHL